MNSAKAQVYDSSQRGSPAVEELKAVFQYRYLLAQLIRRDILTRYKRSILGVAWTMLNPLGTTLILAVVFAKAFGDTQGYAAYVLSGLAAWNFFSQSTNASIIQLVWGGGLLKKIYIPRTVFAVSSIGTGIVNLLLSIVPLVLVMLFTGIPIRWTVVFLPVSIMLIALFALGMGLLISAIAVYFADIAEMYLILLTAWMYLSPVIYTVDRLPEAYRPWITSLNPMYHLIQLFRAPIYEGRIPDPKEILICFLISFVTLILGWLIFTKRADEFAYRV